MADRRGDRGRHQARKRAVDVLFETKHLANCSQGQDLAYRFQRSVSRPELLGQPFSDDIHLDVKAVNADAAFKCVEIERQSYSANGQSFTIRALRDGSTDPQLVTQHAAETLDAMLSAMSVFDDLASDGAGCAENHDLHDVSFDWLVNPVNRSDMRLSMVHQLEYIRNRLERRFTPLRTDRACFTLRPV